MKIKELTICAMFTAVMTVCAWICIPGPIPFTLQTFAVFLSLFVLGGKRAAVSVAVYILLGVIGLPVFSGFQSGIGVILGATGGYLTGFLAMCGIYWPMEKAGKGGCFAATVGMLVCYIFGTVWYIVIYLNGEGAAIGVVLLQCVVPYIVPDAVKLVLAKLISNRIKGINPSMR